MKYQDLLELKKCMDFNSTEPEVSARPVKDALHDFLKKVLTYNDVRLIEFLVGKRRRERREWLPVEEIYQFAKVGLQMGPSKVTELLRKLVKQGIIIEGITLVF